MSNPPSALSARFIQLLTVFRLSKYRADIGASEMVSESLKGTRPVAHRVLLVRSCYAERRSERWIEEHWIVSEAVAPRRFVRDPALHGPREDERLAAGAVQRDCRDKPRAAQVIRNSLHPLE